MAPDDRRMCDGPIVGAALCGGSSKVLWIGIYRITSAELGSGFFIGQPEINELVGIAWLSSVHWQASSDACDKYKAQHGQNAYTVLGIFVGNLYMPRFRGRLGQLR